MMLCLEGMSAFKVGAKREVVFGVVAVLTGFMVGFASSLHDIYIMWGTEMFYIIVALCIVVHAALLYKSLVKGLVVGICGVLALLGIDGVAQYFSKLMGYKIISGELDKYWAITYIAFAATLILLVIALKRFLKRRIDMNIFNNRSMYLVIAISGIMIIISHINFRGDILDAAGDIMYVLFFVSVIAMFAIIAYYISKENALRTEKLIAESSKKYINDLEASYAALRTIKHDYVNIMSSFKLYIENGDMAGLAKYYHDELSEMNNDLLHQDRLLGSLQNIQINEIKSILIYKCSVAAQQQIDINIEIREPVDGLGVSSAIVCQMLGILLDNAIEAAAEADGKKLGIAIIKNPNSKTFIIKNTWKQQEIAIDKLFELGFSTKAKDRGVGLYTVRNYTDKISSLYLETEFDTDHFTQTLTVKDTR
jgi:two-component system sensor histidine kinase AgrC